MCRTFVHHIRHKPLVVSALVPRMDISRPGGGEVWHSKVKTEKPFIFYLANEIPNSFNRFCGKKEYKKIINNNH